MVSASQQLIHVVGVGARRGVLTQYRQVRRYLAIEQGQLLQLRARELAEADLIRLRKQRRQPVPMGPPLANPLI